MPTRLFLVRHGEVDPSWRDRLYGSLDVPLSRAGEAEACMVAERLRNAPDPSVVVSSGLSRTVFGAEKIIGTHSIQHERDGELRELERGDWTGRTRADLEETSPGAWAGWRARPSTCRPPNGESLEDLARRVLPRLDHWSELYAGECVAVVAHLWVIRVAVCRSLSLCLDRALQLAVPTGELVVIDWPAGGGERSSLRPTLAGFGTDVAPIGRGWFRGPQSTPDTDQARGR